MNREEEMILENMQSELKTINKNILYLCRHSANTEARIESIETCVIQHTKDLNSFQRRVSMIEGKLVAGCTFIAIIISLIMNLIVI